MIRVRMGQILIRELTDADRAAISAWSYAGELSIYNPGPAAAALWAPDHVALVSTTGGDMVGYGTMGSEARVPGGAYEGSDEILDLGLGLHPDLVGHGQGSQALLALIEHGLRAHVRNRVRVTIALANKRATRLVMRLEFRETHRFERPTDGRRFVQYERDATMDRSDQFEPR